MRDGAQRWRDFRGEGRGGRFVSSVDRREGAGTGPEAERGTWETRRLRSIAIV